jgi:hypothetical protein
LCQFIDIYEGKKRAIIKYIPAVVFIQHDGGRDQKNTPIQNMAALIAFYELLKLAGSPIKRNIEEESQSSVSTLSPRLTFTETPPLSILSLDDIPNPHLPNYQDIDIDLEGLNFYTDYTIVG